MNCVLRFRERAKESACQQCGQTEEHLRGSVLKTEGEGDEGKVVESVSEQAVTRTKYSPAETLGVAEGILSGGTVRTE